jgi:hypothetical protein
MVLRVREARPEAVLDSDGDGGGREWVCRCPDRYVLLCFSRRERRPTIRDQEPLLIQVLLFFVE